MYFTRSKKNTILNRINTQCILKKEIIMNSGFCISRIKRNTIIKTGSFGRIFHIQTKKSKLDLIIKETKITKYKEELFHSSCFSKVVENKMCPNFPLLYDFSFCNNCVVFNKCMCMAIEKFDGNLNDLNFNSFSEELMNNILFQCLYSLGTAQILFGTWHNDIKKDNFLFKKIYSGGFWKYSYKEVSYYVPNLGFLIALSDFGVSHMFKLPTWNVSEDQYKRKEKNNKIKINYQKKFLMDNLDIIRMFIGGKRTNQPGFHNAISNHLIKFTSKLQDLIKGTNNLSSPLHFYDSMMLISILFKNYTKIKHGIIDEYKIK